MVVLPSRWVFPFKMLDELLAVRPGEMLWMQQTKADHSTVQM